MGPRPSSGHGRARAARRSRQVASNSGRRRSDHCWAPWRDRLGHRANGVSTSCSARPTPKLVTAKTSLSNRSFECRVAVAVGARDRGAKLFDDLLVRVEHAGHHRWHRLASVRWTTDACDLCGVARVGDSDPAKRLHALSEIVDQLELLTGVLVQQEVQLEERRASHEPVVLLVQAVQDHGVGEDLIQH